METTKRRKSIKTVVSFLTALALIVSGFAWSSIAMAADTVHMTAQFKVDGGNTAGTEFTLYKVGTVVDNEFKLDEPYSAAGVDMDFSKDTSEADMMSSAQTLYDYIKAHGLKGEEQTATLDSDGEMVFEVEDYVLYLLASDDEVKIGEKTYSAMPMYMWHIHGDDSVVTVKPKETTKPHDVVPVDYTVVKHWSGDSATSRPESIQVELYEDGALQETVTLNADNDWSYSWTDDDGEGKWTCVEKNVPKGYKCTVKTAEGGTEFIVTNKTTNNPPNNPTKPDKPNKPRTGDPTTLRWAVVAMGLSGLGLLVAGFRRKRED